MEPNSEIKWKILNALAALAIIPCAVAAIHINQEYFDGRLFVSIILVPMIFGVGLTGYAGYVLFKFISSNFRK